MRALVGMVVNLCNCSWMLDPTRSFLLVCVALVAASGLRRRAVGEIAGIASVIDADTIEIHGQRIRLHGIDAPERSQTCLDRPAGNGAAASGRRSPCRI